MDVVHRLTTTEKYQPIQCLDMHTTGEPTRIVLAGYPDLKGTLLEQRVKARAEHDHIRQRLILEPRGHNDMYGAILRSDTEFVRSGTAHIGVLFLTNEGYSTMCGHATIALGRFLFDTRDPAIFPKRNEVRVSLDTLTAEINIHPPCGVVKVTVPVTADGQRSDPSRPVSFVNVPSFATGVHVEIGLPPSHRWPELKHRTNVRIDMSYGGAFYCIVSATELGFPQGLRSFDFDAMSRATKLLKDALTSNPTHYHLFTHPEHDDLSFLYSVLVTDTTLGQPSSTSSGAETGLCYFSDQQLDRSPTGSAVAAREALAVAKSARRPGQRWTYHSLVSNASAESKGGFDSEIVEIVEQREGNQYPLVTVRVEGTASYVGVSTFVIEPEDGLGPGGFVFEKLVPSV